MSLSETERNSGEQTEKDAWKVDTDSHDGKDYVGDKIYVSEGGSTFAVTKDCDIISVCKKIGDSTTSGHELLEKAVKAGSNLSRLCFSNIREKSTASSQKISGRLKKLSSTKK